MKLRGMCVKAGAIVAVLGIFCGCDDKSGSRHPQYSDADSNQASDAGAASRRPTTQELLSGEYKRISLFPLPLTINAPKSWSVESLAEHLYLLQGPAPGSSIDVQIQLAE